MATDVGKVGIVMKGAYNSENTYENLDCVSYNGGLYIAKQNVPANTAPTNTTYWQVGIDAASLAQYENIAPDLTATNATVDYAYKAQVGKIVALALSITATGTSVSLSGIPPARFNVFVGQGYNNGNGQTIPVQINIAGAMNFPGASISNGNSLRIHVVYPTS